MMETALIIALLAIMEISLSFDNAVVNAGVLTGMTEKWRKRFLTWGMLVAVLGMRLIMPIVIVALTAQLGIIEVLNLAISQPEEYSRHVILSHIQIASFGGVFLLMVFLTFVINVEAEIHWIPLIDKWSWRQEGMEACIALSALMAIQLFIPPEMRVASLVAGIIGLITYIAIDGLSSAWSDVNGARTGLAAFMYLEVLDMSFSLDGVIGAFALSNNIFVIMAGLGIGAYFVRSLTIRLVHTGFLKQYIHLEHGAHYGIGALAILMLLSTFMRIPEIVTGLVGVSFIGAAIVTSWRYNQLERARI